MSTPRFPGVRLVVFDLDGTLADATPDLTTGINEALAQLAPGTRPLSLAEVRSFVGEGARVLVERSLARLALPLTAEEVLPAFLSAYRAHLLDATYLYPGALETLDALRGRALAVLTNKPGDLSRSLLAGLGVKGRFFRISGGADQPHRKPDPRGLLDLMTEAGATASETVLVGDSAVDVATGRAAGVAVIGVT